ncbi:MULTISPECIES: polysaccharide deacetylase family sporulation protein PdaB [Thermoactinomyces]|jgi:polysaccharide deacetylase family sporulation protein PdaB|uniref:Polysaccharide deacetylase family sporulation protein PdaB n=1 Tax=Thermoactinomyces daqus TaxID=1329516 RepID=A0A7W1X927_9BACL|nr:MULTISPECIES: polysaccharide deacetylase family sporulation protein PdaB [Thermoactinomyces]MBA4542316.1 polysaccharide deacetylase family sporulation protein PdaB [Thermoactinomyces daqus]MBH8598897.1 polysaccharide deacetylase family sporulation protein PdaB [Thermoactinomyces sp. CICC 10523]MBH8604882.1 polysaccharide deacetylase family sporulation protein PdaB [Thermoactinomyces sp. CICC 10522]MBH8607292.1 polysaccharide deacetylase family sporulation protein PdaB [Thermoactinomyces sp. 
MNYFLVLSGKRLKRALMILIAFLFAAGIFYAENENIQVFMPLDPGPSAIYSVDTNKKQVALTFDISWGEERTGPILDVLEQKGLKKATFFLSSPWAESHPDLVKRIVDMGYEIGSHGHRHDNYSEYNDQQIRTQIGKADAILTKLTGKKPKLIRFPNGDFDKRVLQIAGQMGYTTIQWDTDSFDWMNPGKEKIVKRVLSKVHPGDIILMHASDSCRQTHEALPEIIDSLRKQGYQFVTVSELISGSRVDTKSVD